MITIVFEAHAKSLDDESDLASGWNDARLSQQGINQAKQLADRYAAQRPDAIFCSDLKRSYQTATIAFDFDPKLIFSDWRLRECNFGEHNGSLKAEIKAIQVNFINTPFPGGESFDRCCQKVASFLGDLKSNWDGRRVMIIGHPTTLFCLEQLINNKPLQQSLIEPWDHQPGWQFQLS